MGPGRHTAVGALLAAALLLSAAVPGARAQGETEDEDFSYLPGADNGPENWGKIKAEWANCSVGRMQSPIDLSDERAQLVQSLGYLDTSYRAAESTIVNSGGHYVMSNLYDLELHMVHQTVTNKTAVIGVLYEIGPIKDPFLHKLEPYIKHIKNTKDQPKDVGVLDPQRCPRQRLLRTTAAWVRSPRRPAPRRSSGLSSRRLATWTRVPGEASQGCAARRQYDEREAAPGGEQQRHQHLPPQSPMIITSIMHLLINKYTIYQWRS
ncbi:hypothetical protein BDA96_07G166000 [Sorghum bicolor]|uniref:Alpha-carbonic anhydrase domain-containing protein n=1 Tax=Sorghum bicolor TaxID=4558 RepID=A0A921QKL0_SORBI|nr:hypothetical protein BDA96_07G166000 [Sorghum bicolor]